MYSQAALNYGRAMVELAQAQQSLDRVLSAARQLISDLQISQLLDFFKHPKVPAASKCELLQRIVSEDAPRDFRNFLNLIIERRRESLLVPILETVITEALKAEGYEMVELISARLYQPLSRI